MCAGEAAKDRQGKGSQEGGDKARAHGASKGGQAIPKGNKTSDKGDGDPTKGKSQKEEVTKEEELSPGKQHSIKPPV